MLFRNSLVASAIFVVIFFFSWNVSSAAEPQYVTIPDQYIITFRDGVSRQDALQLTRQLTAQHRLRLRHTYRDTVRGFSATLPPGALDVLRNHPDIVAIEQNGYWYIDRDGTDIQTVDAPSNLQATAVGDVQIDLAWTDNATTEIGFQIQRSTTGIGGAYTPLSLQLVSNLESYTDTDVVIGQEYCYQVRVGDALGNIGPFSNQTCAIIEDNPPTDPPAAPTGLTATTVDDQRIDLTWNDNADDETGFRIERATGAGGAFAEIDLAGMNVTAYQDTALPADTEFCYRVRAYNDFGNSAYTTEMCATTDPTPPMNPPAAPTGLTATTIDDQRIDLAWIDNADDETGFRIERATGAGGAFAEIDLVGIDVTVYQDTTLDADTEFCYRVRAYNGFGDSAYTAEMCATTDPTPPPTSPIGAPTDLAAAVISDTQIDLSWVDNATEEGGFEIQRSTSGIGGPYVQLQIVLGADQTGYTDNSVVADTEYCYQVRAGSGSLGLGEFSNQTCATPGTPPPTDPPADPTGLATSVVSFQRIDLTWNDNSDDEDGFEVERAEGAGGAFVSIDMLGAGVTSYQDSALQAETEFCYRVRAFNAAGDSGYTAEMCATTPEEPPPGNCLDTGNHDDLTETWGITQVNANLNASWQATQTAGCELTPWFFGLDTGVDSDHSDLNVVEIMGFIAADPGNTGEDGHGHGTHTAGSAAAIDGNGGVVGVAPGAQVHGFKVCDDAGSCALDDIMAGVDEVTARKLANPNQPMVANMSLGGGITEANDTAVRRSVNAGVVYTLSAGNGSLNGCVFPADAQNSSPARTGDDLINAQDGSDGDTARINGVITVTSSGQTDTDVNCNFGNPVTVAAPGDNIWSSTLNNGYGFSSGTSMAAPHAAGAAILYLHSNPTATPTEVEQAIVNELDPWTTDDNPNADGRLDVQGL